MSEVPEVFTVVHPKHGRVTVSREQWNEKAHVTGWDEKTARKNGYVPEHEPKGKEIAAKLDKAAAKIGDKDGDGKPDDQGGDAGNQQQ